jgi:hypothetical protein
MQAHKSFQLHVFAISACMNFPRANFYMHRGMCSRMSQRAALLNSLATGAAQCCMAGMQ